MKHIPQDLFKKSKSEHYEHSMRYKNDFTEFIDGREVNADIMAIAVAQRVVDSDRGGMFFERDADKLLEEVVYYTNKLNDLYPIDTKALVTKVSLMLVPSLDLMKNDNKRELVQKYLDVRDDRDNVKAFSFMSDVLIYVNKIHYAPTH